MINNHLITILLSVFTLVICIFTNKSSKKIKTLENFDEEDSLNIQKAVKEIYNMDVESIRNLGVITKGILIENNGKLIIPADVEVMNNCTIEDNFDDVKSFNEVIINGTKGKALNIISGGAIATKKIDGTEYNISTHKNILAEWIAVTNKFCTKKIKHNRFQSVNTTADSNFAIEDGKIKVNTLIYKSPALTNFNGYFDEDTWDDVVDPDLNNGLKIFAYNKNEFQGKPVKVEKFISERGGAAWDADFRNIILDDTDLFVPSSDKIIKFLVEDTNNTEHVISFDNKMMINDSISFGKNGDNNNFYIGRKAKQIITFQKKSDGNVKNMIINSGKSRVSFMSDPFLNKLNVISVKGLKGINTTLTDDEGFDKYNQVGDIILYDKELVSYGEKDGQLRKETLVV